MYTYTLTYPHTRGRTATSKRPRTDTPKRPRTDTNKNTRTDKRKLTSTDTCKHEHTDTNIYHPLCALSTAGNVLDRIFQSRIQEIVENLLSDGQYRFRKGRSTLDTINLVVSLPRTAISIKR